MRERDGYIPGVPCWVDTAQPDAKAAAAFYSELFGWEIENVTPPGSPGEYSIARLSAADVAAISSLPDGAPGTAVWNMYIWVDSADAAAERVWQAGGRVLADPMDVSEAGRMAVLADAEGAPFSVWQAGTHKGARVVNEPGSVNFNVLNTRDLDRAKVFYGSVFGWELLDLGDGGAMWMLPGYGDFLECSEPGLRKQQAQMGAPDGFADVVATLSRIDEDQQHVTPHWGVTFRVDDADATATKAAELGGTVLVAPFDAPWVRMTIMADPQGATFTASKFAPENRDLASARDTMASAA